MKDNFSKVANLYSQFRPSYPAALFDFLIPLVHSRKIAWDAGTGNGQIASELANYFEKIFATDLSEKQIKNAIIRKNIIYKVEKAEQTTFGDNEFDLITVAQAIHWFDFSKFYAEVKRTLKPEGIIAVIGYGLCIIDQKADKIIDHLYSNILNSYWDEERKYIDEHYKTIPFPFIEIPTPAFKSVYDWNLEQLIGFLNSWSAVQHYKDRNNNENPLDEIINNLRSCWQENEKKKVSFPAFLRVGKKS
ncbi:MAG TPA: class I SAM-dependent methyltransferase [Bacteroidia bacterium]|nr:class I SAM-dependent methyltransferase [Bacteroidia bacterium]